MAQDLNESACICCRRRKVKCDRLLASCSACIKIEVPCRYPSPPSEFTATTGVVTSHGCIRWKPRGPYKKGKTPREKELEDMGRSMARRCEELERLIQNTAPADALDAFSVSPTLLDRTMRHSSTASVNVDFNFGKAPQELTASSYREGLSVSSPSSDASQPAMQRPLPGNFAAERVQKPEHAERLPHPPCNQIFELWQIYMIRVDPVTKLIHCPSFSEQLSRATRRPETIETSMHMLMFSIYFASASSLSEDEATDRFEESKDVLLARYNHGMQRMLESQDILSRPSIYVLQALVLHAVCLRRHDDDDQALFAKIFKLAIHTARLMGLNEDDNTVHAPLEVEIRRRCWWTILRMRHHLVPEPGWSIDKAEVVSDFSLPLNINDIDLSSTADDTPKARTAITDMSYFLFTLELWRLGIKARKLGESGSSPSEVDATTCNKLEIFEQHVKRLENDFLNHCDPTRPFDWFLLLTARAVLTPLEITYLEYSREAAIHGFRGTRVGELDSERKFSLRLDIFECWHMLKTNEKLKPWTWFIRNFQQAVTVSDIYVEMARSPVSAHKDRARDLLDLTLAG